VRLVAGGVAEPVLAVDGAFGAPGLELSHWPGNRTPRALRHDLSTGAALAFAALPPAERARLAAGATAVVNNHYDTDGTCALFAASHPDEALPRSAALLDSARAGDFFQIPSAEALALDAIVTGLTDPARSPLAPELAGLPDLARKERATAHLMEHLGALLDGDRAPYRALFEPVLARARADLAALARCARTDDATLELTVWQAPARTAAAPGRHALFGSTTLDRALVLAAEDGGTTCRLVLGTLSWFDLVTVQKPPRPDLAGLASALNELEGTAPEDACAWRAQDAASPSPELWFGGAEVAPYAEHNQALAPSRLALETLLARVRAALARPLARHR
jgi:hypothetical protein